jgi:hypothetical protein
MLLCGGVTGTKREGVRSKIGRRLQKRIIMKYQVKCLPFILIMLILIF